MFSWTYHPQSFTMDPLKGRTNVLSVQPREQEVRITVRNASPPVFQVVVPSIIITQKRPKISTNSFPYSAPKAQSGWCGWRVYKQSIVYLWTLNRVQELCESRGGRPGLPVLTSLVVSVDVKLYWTMLTHSSQLVPNMSTASEDIKQHNRTESWPTSAVEWWIAKLPF